MKKTVNIKWLLIPTLASPLLVGGLASLLTRDAMIQYGTFNKPPFFPPGWLFPVVWTILYLVMGFASWLVIREKAEHPKTRNALAIYIVQLVVNFFWSLIFFGAQSYLFAFIWLMCLWGLVILCGLMFFRIKKAAGILMLPYVLWVTFAAVLNFSVYVLSVTPMPS